MNFKVMFCGYKFKTYDECIKLIIHSAAQSDYITESRAFKRLTPFSPLVNEITITGSSKKYYREIVIDFDKIYETPKNVIELSPSTIELNTFTDNVHYWGLVGAFFKVVGDISPAYVTGYLLEKNMKKELEVFTQYLSQLPFATQISLNEMMMDND